MQALIKNATRDVIGHTTRTIPELLLNIGLYKMFCISTRGREGMQIAWEV